MAEAVEHPTVVLLSAAADEPCDWFRAGSALSALLLTATQLHVLAEPTGRVIDEASTRWAVQRLLGTVGVPQLSLHLGQVEA